MTEVWFRNPHNYVRELAEVLGQNIQPQIVWDRGILVKKVIDPVKHAKIYFGEQSNFRILCVGPQGSAELDKDHGLDRPIAVYPTWEYGEDFGILEEMCSSPIGEDIDACSSDVPKDERPVIGQEHRVVVTNLPNAQLAANRPFYRHLMELQEENSHCTLMLHGSYSYRIMFGQGIAACDIEPRSDAANGKVVLPNGKVLAYARTVSHQQWVNTLGFSVTDLKEPKNRCKFNIKSAQWAGEHYDEDVRFKSQGAHDVDYDSPVTTMPTTSITTRNQNVLEAVATGDKINCDTCSLNETCKFAREGSVCTLPGSETNSLARLFKSRDSGHIIDGLGVVLGAQVHRLKRGMDMEEELEILDPEVSKIMNQIFQNGKSLAKLIDPNLTKPLVQINNGGSGGSRQEVVASVIRALEAQGFTRDQITPEMFQSTLIQMHPELKNDPAAIEAVG